MIPISGHKLNKHQGMPRSITPDMLAFSYILRVENYRYNAHLRFILPVRSCIVRQYDFLIGCCGKCLELLLGASMNFETQFAGEPLSADDEVLRAKRKKIIVIAVILFASLLIAAAVYNHFSKPDQTPVTTAPVVTVITPGQASVLNVINATGTLGARREMPVGVVGEGGRVAAVLVEPGSWVAAGQVMARIERSVQAEQARSATASVGVAAADARLAQNELERAQALVARGFISKSDIDRKTATRDAAYARLRVSQAQAREQSARIGRLDIRAPAAGLVLTRTVEPGQIVSSGSGALFRIARGGEMELLAKVSESDLQHLPVGVSAKVTPVGSGQSYAGQVWQVAPVIDAQSRQGTARIALSYNRNLRPGGFAEAEIVSGAAQAPVLPESAIQSDAKGSYVYIVNGDDLVERRDVTVGQVGDAGVAISSGLSGNEKVVLLAGGFLTVNQKVVPKLQDAAKR
jgi:HlyD family secretion protein